MHVKITIRYPSILWLAMIFAALSALLSLTIFLQVFFDPDQIGMIWLSLPGFVTLTLGMWGCRPLQEFMMKLDSASKFLNSRSGHRLIDRVGALNFFFIAAITLSVISSMSWIVWIAFTLHLGALMSVIRYTTEWDSEELELECANSGHRYIAHSPLEWFIKVTFHDRARINCKDCLRLPTY